MRHYPIALILLLAACPRQRPPPPPPMPTITAPLPAELPEARTLARQLIAAPHPDLPLLDPHELVYDPLHLQHDGTFLAEAHQELGGDRLFCAETGDWAMIPSALSDAVAALKLTLRTSTCPGRISETSDEWSIHLDPSGAPSLRFR